MIGVAVHQPDWKVVEEFFELFKTPWEPAVVSRKYKVVLSTEGSGGNLQADVLLAYGADACPIDMDAAVDVEPVSGPSDVEWDGCTFPIYGRVGAFGVDASAATLRANGQALDYRSQSGVRVVRRVGYDLFEEIRYLLTNGQPASNALTPTLELHIALLRSLLLECGISFAEIPPRPDRYEFICCLTHDVDFFGIRGHRFDRTLAGFIARASVGTLVGLARGTRTFREAIRNWGALLSLPLVFMRLRPDFWHPFHDYARAEAGRRSTFFLVPFKARAGVAPDGVVEEARAVSYEIGEIQHELKTAVASGAEVGVHGIDAWRDADAGRAELNRLTSLTGESAAGVRMHWLYFASDSPTQLEAAGFEYDSTWGYNDAIGYKAGTSQVFRLQGAADLMELPMSIMDSALFYADRMGLAGEAALSLCRRIVAGARRYGGTVVINWHCRSLAPERLWGRFYQELLAELDKNERAWFATAAEAVSWFRWRRSIRFETDAASDAVAVVAPSPISGPAAVVRVHRPAVEKMPVENIPFDGRQVVRCVV